MGIEYPHATVIKIRKFRFLLHENRPKWSQVVTNGSNNVFRVKTNSCNRFPVPKNMGVEYSHATVIKLPEFPFFPKKNPTVKKGRGRPDFSQWN